jgi:glycerophosphoryl diester phosphodiesterase
MAGDWYRGLLLDTDPLPNWAELADYFEATTINIDGRSATREFVEDIMDTQRPILAYTINDPQLARQLRQWGVDCLFTDDPDAVNDDLLKPH